MTSLYESAQIEAAHCGRTGKATPSAKVWLGMKWTSAHSLGTPLYVNYSAHSHTEVHPNEPVHDLGFYRDGFATRNLRAQRRS